MQMCFTYPYVQFTIYTFMGNHMVSLSIHIGSSHTWASDNRLSPLYGFDPSQVAKMMTCPNMTPAVEPDTITLTLTFIKSHYM